MLSLVRRGNFKLSSRSSSLSAFHSSSFRSYLQLRQQRKFSNTAEEKSHHYTGIKVYNTLEDEIVPLILPRQQKLITWYTCGPTVYDQAHLGHARNYVAIDILQRILRHYFQYNVVHVMGMTDVDDKIMNRAKERGMSPLALARHFEEEFDFDLKSLGVQRPNATTRVTEHLQEIVSYIEKILQQGFAYEVNGSVYFDLHSFVAKSPSSSQYSMLFPGRTFRELSSLEGGEEEGKGKRHPQHFALWKAHKEGENLQWPSPWGPGRPGWHIECSAMSHSVFGSQLDIHAGGIDLKFPHHCNEIAQCEAHHHQLNVSNKSFNKWPHYFLHVGHLHISGLKMSKSLKNFITIREFLQEHPASRLRWFCLMFRYRTGVDYTEDRMQAAASIENKFNEFFMNVRNAVGRKEKMIRKLKTSDPGASFQTLTAKRWRSAEFELQKSLDQASAAVDHSFRDDFDTGSAINALLSLVSSTNSYIFSREISEEGLHYSNDLLLNCYDYVYSLLTILGVSPSSLEPSAAGTTEGRLKTGLDILVDFRSEVRQLSLPPKRRKEKEIAGSVPTTPSPSPDEKLQQILKKCDEVRNNLTNSSAGIKIEDHKDGVSWKLTTPSHTESKNDNK